MDFSAERDRLLQHLQTKIKDSRVLAVMSRIPRELFVPDESRFAAYDDDPQPIGFNQTISQPYIVALMTAALKLKGDEKVLEVGTGSGYQTAILSLLTQTVISTERIPELVESARKTITSLGLQNINLYHSCEKLGWEKEAPYDAIIVTAAAPRVPVDLLAQLAIGGRMVLPVGSRYLQELVKVTRCKDRNTIENLGACRFVPLIGKDAWEKE